MMPDSSVRVSRVHPAAKTGGQVVVPGDKSISHRVAMLGGVASGTSEVRGFLRSEDCLHSLSAMEAFGAQVEHDVNGLLRITGTGGRLHQPGEPIYLGNSGTSIRLLAGLVAGFDVDVVFTGDPSLSRRPMGRVKVPLELMGASLELQGGQGKTPPIRIRGRKLKGIRYEMPMASAQVKSCVLLAGLSAEGPTEVIEPGPTRDHTERLFRALGLPLEVDGARVLLNKAGSDWVQVPAGNWLVPGDFSSAAFHFALGAVPGGGGVTVRQVGINARRTAFLDVLRRMGARVEVRELTKPGDIEPFADVTVSSIGNLRGTDICGQEIPNLIDELPMAAVLASLAEGVTTIRDAEELRVKESDRIACVAANLRKFGVEVEELPDGMVVKGRGRPAFSGRVETHGDHRIAMAFSVLGLFSPEPVEIIDTGCIETSYPGFYNDLCKLGGQIESSI